MLHVKFKDDFKSSIPVLWRVRKMVARTFSPLMWRQRLLVWACGILIGLLAAAFSMIADKSQAVFMSIVHINRFIPLVMTPAIFALAAGATVKWFPSIPGSGIPQAIAARELHDKQARQWLLGARSIFGKIFLTVLCLMSGASIGREGPTVQVGAALLMMCAAFKVLNTDRSLILAGAASGIAAAFNTPIAGIVFAIEEMARGFHRRNSTLILMSIVLSGAASMTILGSYNYFGVTTKDFVPSTDWIPLLVIGVFGGLGGALFTWMLTHGLMVLKKFTNKTPLKNPALFAAACGLLVAVLGLMTDGDTYGTGYGLANDLLHGRHLVSWGCAIAKLLATALSSICNIPGGIFSPSLSIGASMGASMLPFFKHTAEQVIVVMSMVAYLSGVTQAPITSAIIVLEITGNSFMPAPLIAIAVLASAVSQVFCPVSLYHALAHQYVGRALQETKKSRPHEQPHAEKHAEGPEQAITLAAMPAASE